MGSFPWTYRSVCSYFDFEWISVLHHVLDILNVQSVYSVLFEITRSHQLKSELISVIILLITIFS
jgi:hypothetical protein